MHPQWPQPKGSSGRQAETQVRLDALTRQSWGGDGNASTVAASQRKQRKASRDTSAAWCLNTTVLGGGTVMHPQWPQAKGSNGRQAETQVRLDALTRQSWGDGDASTVAASQRKQRQASRDTSPAWCINTTVLGGDGNASTVAASQRKQRQASRDTSAAWCLNTTVLGGDGDASTVAASQRKQRQASRDTSPAWCLNTTVLGGRWCIHSGRKPNEAAAGKPRHKSGLMH